MEPSRVRAHSQSKRESDVITPTNSDNRKGIMGDLKPFCKPSGSYRYLHILEESFVYCFLCEIHYNLYV